MNKLERIKTNIKEISNYIHKKYKEESLNNNHPDYEQLKPSYSFLFISNRLTNISFTSFNENTSTRTHVLTIDLGESDKLLSSHSFLNIKEIENELVKIERDKKLTNILK